MAQFTYTSIGRVALCVCLAINLVSCNQEESPTESTYSPQKVTSNTVTKPDYKIALTFINDYVAYCNDLTLDMDLVEWINLRSDVTEKFKSEVQKVMEEAFKNDPELGLGFDPLFDAQDFPEKFIIEKSENEYLIVKGKGEPQFSLTMKLKREGNEWKVDGCGVIRVPKNKRMPR